ncbi:glycosyltransferase family 87 protein [Streptomyces thioluteus]|uniref:glycosyltransferase family 87 protein n=1 Tax=Streptomyces thioluteus TaxID=66431 RepID=UPI0031E71994
MVNAERGGPAGPSSAGPRTVLALGALWLVAGVLAVRQAAVVLRRPPERRFTELATWIGDHGVLRTRGSFYDNDQFTGTPFGGLVLRPLTRAAEHSLGIGWTIGTLLLVVALALVAARSLPGPLSRRTALLAAPVAVSLTVLSLPVRNTFTLGQTSILPVLLVVPACCLPRLAAGPGRSAGVLCGLAAALQPAVLLFVPLLRLTDRRRAAVTAGATFAAATALAWAAAPDDSWTYWIHHLAGAGLGDQPDGLANQSLHGLLLRLGLHGPVEIALYAVRRRRRRRPRLRRAVHYARDGQPAARRRDHRLRHRRRLAHRLPAPATVDPARPRRPGRPPPRGPAGVAGARRARHDAAQQDPHAGQPRPSPPSATTPRCSPRARRRLRRTVPHPRLRDVGAARADPGRRPAARPLLSWIPLMGFWKRPAQPPEPAAGADADTGGLLRLLVHPRQRPPTSGASPRPTAGRSSASRSSCTSTSSTPSTTSWRASAGSRAA